MFSKELLCLHSRNDANTQDAFFGFETILGLILLKNRAILLVFYLVIQEAFLLQIHGNFLIFQSHSLLNCMPSLYCSRLILGACCQSYFFLFQSGSSQKTLFPVLLVFYLWYPNLCCISFGNRCATGKSRQNSRGTEIAKFSGAAPLMTVQLTDNTGVAPVKGVPPAKVMSPWSGGTGIAKFAGAAPFMTVQLTAIQGAVLSKLVPPAKVVPLQRHHYSWCHPLSMGFILINKPSCEGLALVAQ